MRDAPELLRLVAGLDGRGYKAYKALAGSWRFADTGPLPFVLHIDHVQGDPFAAPSRVRAIVEPVDAALPECAFAAAPRRRALASWLALRFADAADSARRRAGSGASGLIAIDRPGQQLLDRTCLRVDAAGRVEARFVVGLPAAGRRILGDAAADLLGRRVPEVVAEALRHDPADAEDIRAWTHAAEDAEALRAQLRPRGLVAFVGDGAVLPRRSGVDDRPLDDAAARPFESPSSLRVELEAPHAGPVTGMGVPAGVSLVVGGGFHGKSTLLAALERGVWDHCPGDGRERVVTDPGAVRIRAEDGRRITGVDLSGFIGQLPFGRDTRAFHTDNASGSTSQAANIVEAVEAGARVLLIDEDTAATNFMIRDGRMQALIADADEPIIPFVDRVRPLYEERGVSTVLVVGGSGDYFDVADRVIAMRDYTPTDVTGRAHAIAAEHRSGRRPRAADAPGAPAPRVPAAASIDARRGRREVSLKVRGPFELQLGEHTIDLSAVGGLVDASQTRALAAAIIHARDRHMDDDTPLATILERVVADIEARGLDVLSPHPAGDHAAFRGLELAAAINRLRTLRVRAQVSEGAPC